MYIIAEIRYAFEISVSRVLKLKTGIGPSRPVFRNLNEIELHLGGGTRRRSLSIILFYPATFGKIEFFRHVLEIPVVRIFSPRDGDNIQPAFAKDTRSVN